MLMNNSSQFGSYFFVFWLVLNRLSPEQEGGCKELFSDSLEKKNKGMYLYSKSHQACPGANAEYVIRWFCCTSCLVAVKALFVSAS